MERNNKKTLTNGNHALAVVVEILLDNLEQTLNGSARGAVMQLVFHFTQILILLLHLGKSRGETANDALVGGGGDGCLDEQAKVEDELIAQILSVRDDDGVAENGVLSVGGVDGDVAVAKGLARDNVLLQDVKVDEGRARGCFRGGDASWGRLRDYFGACVGWLVIGSHFCGW